MSAAGAVARIPMILHASPFSAALAQSLKSPPICYLFGGANSGVLLHAIGNSLVIITGDLPLSSVPKWLVDCESAEGGRKQAEHEGGSEAALGRAHGVESRPPC